MKVLNEEEYSCTQSVLHSLQQHIFLAFFSAFDLWKVSRSPTPSWLSKFSIPHEAATECGIEISRSLLVHSCR